MFYFNDYTLNKYWIPHRHKYCVHPRYKSRVMDQNEIIREGNTECLQIFALCIVRPGYYIPATLARCQLRSAIFAFFARANHSYQPRAWPAMPLHSEQLQTDRHPLAPGFLLCVSSVLNSLYPVSNLSILKTYIKTYSLRFCHNAYEKTS